MIAKHANFVNQNIWFEHFKVEILMRNSPSLLSNSHHGWHCHWCCVLFRDCKSFLRRTAIWTFEWNSLLSCTWSGTVNISTKNLFGALRWKSVPKLCYIYISWFLWIVNCCHDLTVVITPSNLPRDTIVCMRAYTANNWARAVRMRNAINDSVYYSVC